MTVSREGFPKKCRLSKPSEFRQVFSSRSRSVDSQFLVLARQNSQDIARLGLAVSKRKIRAAVGRNRVKRLIRESFRKNQEKLAGLDIVVVSQNRISLSDNTVLLQSLDRHWNRIGR
ncbi:MAG: ribonuclease P protein component [Gammaproteobacteria bacterium]